MASIYSSIIFSLLLCFILAEDNVLYRCEEKKTSSAIECASILKEEEKKEGFHCCYFTGKDTNGENIFKCKFLNDEEYKNLEETTYNMMDQGYTEPFIKCADESSSLYLKLSMLYLILILL